MSGFSNAGLERLSNALKGSVDRGEIPGLVALVARGDDVHVDAFGVQDLRSFDLSPRDRLCRGPPGRYPIQTPMAEAGFAGAAAATTGSGAGHLDRAVRPVTP